MKVKATQGDTPLTWENKEEFEESHHHSLCPYALWFHDILKKGGPISFVKWQEFHPSFREITINTSDMPNYLCGFVKLMV